MPRNALIQYKKTSINTRSRGRILLMLYDGAIRFLEQARVAIDQKRPDLRGERISRAHAIISELNLTLDHEVAPELCANLERLYLYMLNQITDANRTSDPQKLDLVIELLKDLRGAWQEAVQQAENGAAPEPGAPNPDPRSTLQVKG
jgi:flagellar protein FliS